MELYTEIYQASCNCNVIVFGYVNCEVMSNIITPNKKKYNNILYLKLQQLILN